MKAYNQSIVFMGTPGFAVASLKELLEAGFKVSAVVTVPDKPAGRGQKIQESEVKQFAVSKNIPVLQPDKLKDPVFIEQLKEINADLFVVVAFRMLPEMVWSMPRMGTINLHGSLLPHYRGAAPINWAVINGEKETGVTTFFIEKEIDTGKIIYNSKIEILPNDNAGTVHDKLMETGASLLVKTVQSIFEGNVPQISQVDLLKPGETPKLAPKIFKPDCKINWTQNALTINNLIRGLSPYPAAWSVFKNNLTGENIVFKIFDADFEPYHHNIAPGSIVTDEKKYLKVSVHGGYIIINQLQLEGKKRMSTEELLRGFKVAGYSIDW